MRQAKWIVLLLLLTLVVGACAPAAEPVSDTAPEDTAAESSDADTAAESGAVPAFPERMSVDEANAILAEYSAVLLIDVREQIEWDTDGHAPDARLIPLNSLPGGADDIDPDTPVLVICRSGNRSQAGAQALRMAGFSNVSSIDGGMRQWSAAGYEVVCESETVACTFAN